MSLTRYAVVAGVGPGAGAAIAKKFARTYPVILLARTASKLEAISQEIQAQGGTAICVEGDASSRDTLDHVLQLTRDKFGSQSSCAAAVYNVSSRPAWKKFLEVSEEDFTSAFNISCIGGFHFAQALLPSLISSAQNNSSHPPTLIFTGATASLRGSKMLSSFAAAKTASRTLAQSLAREFGPQGVHVSHVIIDGVIDIPGTTGEGQGPEVKQKIAPETIADTYWFLHTQQSSGFTHELEIRPSQENW